MIDRVIATLKDAAYEASLMTRRPNMYDVLLKGYPLPETNCVETKADLVLPIPSTFPEAAPYGFFAVTPITRRTGAWRNISHAAPYRAAVFFSRKCHQWNPKCHDVLTYLGFINQWVSQ